MASYFVFDFELDCAPVVLSQKEIDPRAAVRGLETLGFNGEFHPVISHSQYCLVEGLYSNRFG